MPKPEWGVKRTCPHCETRFYDLQKEPIVCPECGTTYDVDAHGKVSATRERRVAVPAGVDDEELVDDEDLGKDDDADEVDDDALLGDEDEEEETAKGPALSDEDEEEEEVPFKDPDLIDEDEEEDDLDLDNDEDDDEDIDLDLPDQGKR